MEQVCAEAAAEKIRDREKLQSEHTNGDAGKFPKQPFGFGFGFVFGSGRLP